MYYRALKYNLENQKYRMREIPIRKPYYDDFRLVHMDDCITILVTKLKFYIINSTCGLVERTIEFLNYCRAIRHGNYLIAITQDSNVTIWNIKDGTILLNILLEIYRFTLIIEACKDLVIFINNQIYSVYILNIRTKEVRHISTANFACCSKDLLVFSLNDGSIIIRDTNYHCVTSFHCSDISREYTMVDHMEMNEDFLVIEYYELNHKRLLSIFNIKTKVNFNIPILSKGPSYCKILKNRMVFGTDNTSLEIWDMHTQNLLFKIDKVDYSTHSPKFCDGYVYVCRKSAVVRWQMWCLQTGKFIRELRFCRSDEVIAIKNSKLLYKRGMSYWVIRDYEASMYKRTKNKIILNKKRKRTPLKCL